MSWATASNYLRAAAVAALEDITPALLQHHDSDATTLPAPTEAGPNLSLIHI